jgi:hypothetical protein
VKWYQGITTAEKVPVWRERAAMLSYAYIAYLVKFIFCLLVLAQFAFETLLSVLNFDVYVDRRSDVDFF